jgi:hypothetical protein
MDMVVREEGYAEKGRGGLIRQLGQSRPKFPITRLIRSTNGVIKHRRERLYFGFERLYFSFERLYVDSENLYLGFENLHFSFEHLHF